MTLTGLAHICELTKGFEKRKGSLGAWLVSWLFADGIFVSLICVNKAMSQSYTPNPWEHRAQMCARWNIQHTKAKRQQIIYRENKKQQQKTQEQKPFSLLGQSLQCTHGVMKDVCVCVQIGGEHNKATVLCSPEVEPGTPSQKLIQCQSSLPWNNNLGFVSFLPHF